MIANLSAASRFTLERHQLAQVICQVRFSQSFVSTNKRRSRRFRRRSATDIPDSYSSQPSP